MDMAIDILSWVLLVAGAGFLLVGGIGVIRLPDVYTRAHAAGITDTLPPRASRKPKKEEWITNYFTQASFYAAAFFERTGLAIKKFAIIVAVDGSEPQVFTGLTHNYLENLFRVRENYLRIKGI